jgi:hypothetical protein
MDENIKTESKFVLVDKGMTSDKKCNSLKKSAPLTVSPAIMKTLSSSNLWDLIPLFV